MLTNDAILPLLYLLGAGQGLFLACALFASKAGNRRANAYLGALTLVFALVLLQYFVDAIGLTAKFVQLKTLLWPKEFFFGVLIYFYVRELTHPSAFKLSGRQWWHFAPGFAHIGVTWPLLLASPAHQAQVFDGEASGLWLYDSWSVLLGSVELFASIVHISLYLLLSIQLTYRHKQRIKDSFSYTEQVGLDWLRNLLIGVVVVYFSWLADELMDVQAQIDALLDAMLGLTIVALIYGMGYLGLRQPLIFSPATSPDISRGAIEGLELQPPSGEASAEGLNAHHLQAEQAQCERHAEQQTPEKYKKSSLSAALGGELIKELEAVMEQQKLYLDNQLSLPKLAEAMGISGNYLSQAINEQRQQNFFDFINSYRIKDVIAWLDQPDTSSLTILELAMKAGFNSKSAFYTAFRKQTGITPGQYRKQHGK